ncbi:hypothetical protein [Lysinibacillus fusiformis]|nr:hypothetical protein [Lysinibacillus fusiformis]
MNIDSKLSSNSIEMEDFFMTKKTGLFDVDFTLTTKELNAAIKGE